jgi:hypothetical protein
MALWPFKKTKDDDEAGSFKLKKRQRPSSSPSFG